jgi:hypothetical protein
MSYEQFKEVCEEHSPESANQRLAEGWILLGIVPGFDPSSGRGYTCYVLGKALTESEKFQQFIQDQAER